MGVTFFGQKYDYIKIEPEVINQIYDQLFIMSYHMGWSFFEAYSLPIKLRNWFFDKWIERKKLESEIVSS